MSDPDCNSICHDVLATPVDTFVYHSSFVPFVINCSDIVVDPMNKDTMIEHTKFYDVLKKEVSAEIEAEMKSQEFETIEGLVESNKTFDSIIPPEQRKEFNENMISKIRPHYDEKINLKKIEVAKKLRNDPNSLLYMGEANLETQLLQKYKKQNNIALTENKNSSNQKRIQAVIGKDSPKKGCSHVSDLGFIFLERNRIRPIGHTLERAPIHEITLNPGQTVTKNVDLTSSQSITRNDTLETTEEIEHTFSDTQTNSLTKNIQEFYETTKELKLGLSNESKITAKLDKIIDLSNSLKSSIDYTANKIERETRESTSLEKRDVIKTISSQLTTTNSTELKITESSSVADKTNIVYENTLQYPMRLLFRRLMQVLHISYERYGVQLGWSLCMDNPGESIQKYNVENDSPEIQAIKDKWAQATPPQELGAPPSNKTQTFTSKLIRGGIAGKSEDNVAVFTVPAGYAFGNVAIAHSGKNSSASIKNTVVDGNIVTVTYHYGIQVFGNIRLTITVTFVPDAIMDQYNATIDAWRNEQAQKEINQYLSTITSEITQLDTKAVFRSEIMRQIIDKYFGRPVNETCKSISMVYDLFDWENLDMILYPKWWDENTEIDGTQSNKVDFFTASFAKVFLPIKPGKEEDALAFLIAVGVIPNSQLHILQIQKYINDMYDELIPMYSDSFSPDNDDVEDICEACDINLTPLGTKEWINDYEKECNFTVLDRFVTTAPTNGLNIELKPPICDSTITKMFEKKIES